MYFSPARYILNKFLYYIKFFYSLYSFQKISNCLFPHVFLSIIQFSFNFI
ncbi:hypothetical protein CLOSYM_00950 [[Clostridium] symbiosum ATCC 14940]|uniref:Uncharacterized protein n=1 Tax=[Clostridium] symbiosum ATCC 14940 TaxID=411472 RepID=A0ABC9U1N7_CLOSY|nr:hypothetical protein CLOSYM_00950 [[Clostridium] symbiosum ATCC 14940]